jgi:hypothetical protein
MHSVAEDSTGGRLSAMLEELGAVPGVRGATYVLGDYAFGAAGPPLSNAADDLAKTVRRMLAASEQQALSVAELTINLGGVRLLVVPITKEGSVVFVLERDTAASAVRSLLSVQSKELHTLLSSYEASNQAASGASATDDASVELERVRSGELKEVLNTLEQQFTRLVGRVGSSPDEAEAKMREQMHEWLMCCNPSAYTLPLLVDGLALSFSDKSELYTEFMEVAQATISGALSQEGGL